MSTSSSTHSSSSSSTKSWNKFFLPFPGYNTETQSFDTWKKIRENLIEFNTLITNKTTISPSKLYSLVSELISKNVNLLLFKDLQNKPHNRKSGAPTSFSNLESWINARRSKSSQIDTLKFFVISSRYAADLFENLYTLPPNPNHTDSSTDTDTDTVVEKKSFSVPVFREGFKLCLPFEPLDMGQDSESEFLSTPSLIPIIQKNGIKSVEMSPKVVATILAAGFFGLFPENHSNRNSFHWFPIFQHSGFGAKTSSTKLDFIASYFLTFNSQMTFEAENSINRKFRVERFVLKNPTKYFSLDSWKNSKKPLIKLNCEPTSFIEHSPRSWLWADFANRFIGGGTLRHGAVQEEIMFSYMPECLLSLLFCTKMSDTEAIHLYGCRKVGSYKGYGSSFSFDKILPFDSEGAETAIVAFDALPRSRARPTQFHPGPILRELNKAIVAFGPEKRCVSTGRWGCGAFGRYAPLQSLIQWASASFAECPEITIHCVNDASIVEKLPIFAKSFSSSTVGDLVKFILDDFQVKWGKV